MKTILKYTSPVPHTPVSTYLSNSQWHISTWLTSHRVQVSKAELMLFPSLAPAHANRTLLTSLPSSTLPAGCQGSQSQGEQVPGRWCQWGEHAGWGLGWSGKSLLSNGRAAETHNIGSLFPNGNCELLCEIDLLCKHTGLFIYLSLADN